MKSEILTEVQIWLLKCDAAQYDSSLQKGSGEYAASISRLEQ